MPAHTLIQGHPQDTATSKSDSLPYRIDHREIGTAERYKGSRTAVRKARDEPDHNAEKSRKGAGAGVHTASPGSVYWRSRRCQSPARMHR